MKIEHKFSIGYWQIGAGEMAEWLKKLIALKREN